jgi:DNA-binding protein HU-beta
VADTINRLDLINAVAEATGLTRQKSGQALDAALSAVERALAAKGFGSFSLTDRKASKGRNPRTGEEIDIPASTTVRFKAGKGLKDAVSSAE